MVLLKKVKRRRKPKNQARREKRRRKITMDESGRAKRAEEQGSMATLQQRRSMETWEHGTKWDRMGAQEHGEKSRGVLSAVLGVWARPREERRLRGGQDRVRTTAQQHGSVASRSGVQDPKERPRKGQDVVGKPRGGFFLVLIDY